MEGFAMGQVLHGSATTTEAVHRAIQPLPSRGRASLRELEVAFEALEKFDFFIAIDRTSKLVFVRLEEKANRAPLRLSSPY
jgi:hypothetical protein